MVYKKIKVVSLACLVAFTSSLYCWNNTVKNDTDGEIFVTIEYAASGICSPENRTIPSKQQITIDSKICCAQKVTVRSTTGSAKGQSYSLATPRAGIDMTCANFNVRVYIATGNVLMAEANLS